MKSEPDAFSIDDLQKAKDKTTLWEGVRNFQARNFMRQMQKGDLAFFYHSSCAIPAIVGIMEIVKTDLPDLTAQDPQSPYYDPKATPEHPRWYMVKVKFIQKLPSPIPLSEIKDNPALQSLRLVRRGNRLSVMPLSESEWKCILSMAK